MADHDDGDAVVAPNLELLDGPVQNPGLPTIFKIEKPEMRRGRHVRVLARTDSVFCNVQFVRNGGENKLHSHPNLDGLWFVLEGRARFYQSETELLCELGPGEGVMIPRDFRYWFESAGDEDLHLLQVESFEHAGQRVQRVVHAGELEPQTWDLESSD
ncbi:MAG: cupin domain-containing protein [Actinomycetota bacterium]|nr:cupin domain-containing protein [Actinomycetota bacterium]